ncbi:hypothetical protein A4X13_0g2270 [Tilletia indica]|uniref:Uncharacterized protein n=1 Tax=Tilletia indica TaxID=43049 RepID=A0A177THU1_9BASI|nr:hypothetical protein A4X13_0g2270 [Tilletia indica]
MTNEGRASKRVRIEAKGRNTSASPGGISIGHPLRLKPLGNAFFSNKPNARITGLGQLNAFNDEQISIILSHLLEAEALDNSPTTLLSLARVSHALNVFATQDSLWRDAFLLRRDFHSTLRFWAGSWRRTYALHHILVSSSSLPSSAWLTVPQEPVPTPDLFSDHLFHTFVHALTPLQPLLLPTHNKRGHLQANPIPRISARTYTRDAFTTHFAVPNQPCIMTDEPGLQLSDPSDQRWPCAGWTLDVLAEQWHDRIFRAEAIKCSAKTYLAYARSCGAHALRAKGESVPIAYFPSPATIPTSSGPIKVGAFDPYVVPDESTSYLFDASFPSTDPHAKSAWRTPHLLSQSPSGSTTEIDLFSLLGPHHRPDYRWLIAGPERSGSSWHLDPNGTSAWNTVLSGSKLWLMLPPHTPPPGVYVSEDEGEVTSPSSLAEWVSLFGRATYEVHGSGKGGDGKLLVGVCKAGETCYVPSGWWHAVLNLEECVALTQNFVSPTELPYVLHFLKHKPDQISGFKRPRLSSSTSTADLDADADADDEEAAADKEAAASTGPHHQQQQQSTNGQGSTSDSTRDFRWDIFDTFCARLAEFDPSLLERGLEGMRALEGEQQRLDEEGGVVGNGVMGRKRNVNGGPSAGEGGAEAKSTWWEKLKGKGGPVGGEGMMNGGSDDGGEVPSALFSLGGAVDEDELGEVPW